MQQHGEAIQDYDVAIEIDPEIASAYYNRGISEMELGQHKEAIRDHDRAIEIDPKHVGAYNNRGNSKAALGQHKEAIRDYDVAIEIDPERADVYYNRGISKFALSQHKEAIRDHDRAIEIDPKHAGAHNNRGGSKAALGQHKEAIRDYDEALRIQPGHPEAIHNRAMSLVLLQVQGILAEERRKSEEERKELRRKFEEELKATRGDIDERLDYDATLKEMSAAYKDAGKRHDRAMRILRWASSVAYSAVVAFAVWNVVCKKGFMDSLYEVIPFITLATLVLVPFYLWVHSMGRDKARALALREDIRDKRALSTLVQFYSNKGDNPALLRLFDHHTHSNTPSLILGAHKEQPVSIVRNVTKKVDGYKGDGADK